MHEWVELSSQGIQALAVVIIVVSIIFGTLRFLLQLSRRVTDPYRAYKELLGVGELDKPAPWTIEVPIPPATDGDIALRRNPK
jgi:hypothetical protein